MEYGADFMQARCDSTVIFAFLYGVSRHLRSRPAKCYCVMKYIGVMDGVAEVDRHVRKSIYFLNYLYGMKCYSFCT